MNLVIVESPSKGKTIQKYLGDGYEVLASYGHIRDLLPKKGAVDPDNNFAMRYEVIEKNLKHLQAIQKAVKKADTLLLATDPDREGEAIAWHLVEYLKEKKALKGKTVKRVAFYEITKQKVNEAVANPRDISPHLVDAQQARRALDYLVGFNLSPLLWKKVRRGLSAGRVQSPALRLIVEREEEIEKFKAEEYWSIEADLLEKKKTILARLIEYQGKKCQKFDIADVGTAEAARDQLLSLAKGELIVSKIEKKERTRQPVAPFTTSTLQQEAIRKLGFTSKRAMSTAQQLYEGVDVGAGTVGLITYMRTDSVNLGAEAIENLRNLITERYGADNLPKEPRVFTTKSKNAQEAHEAIRPTDAARTPESIKSFLSPDQFKLYDLIWKRTVACQMIPAVMDTVAVDFKCGPTKTGGVFRANGSTIKVPGFMSVYQEGEDDNTAEEDEKLLPPFKEKQVVPLTAIRSEQHFTEPPPRFTEASLVKALEEHGIGRPSTYASIISTLQSRDYAILEQKRFTPTDVGKIVSQFLTKYFTRYVDYEFTARMEDNLDAISRGEKEWIPALKEFWEHFIKQLAEIETTVQRSDVTQEKMDEACPDCGKPLSIRLGRSGRFIGCTTYPECKYTRSLEGGDAEAAAAAQEIIADRKCPKCEGDLVMKTGRYGRFIGCANYPKCKHIESLNKPKTTESQCAECHQGMIVQRRSRFGKIFYSCERYPDCKYALWNEPVNEQCPKCAWPLLTIKTTKRRGTEKVCPHEGCGFAEPYEQTVE
jgi:DNA topoisomerase-1